MLGFLKRLIFVLVLAAFTAASLLLWRSPDPLYTFDSWRAFGRFADYDLLIADTARKHDIDPMLVKAVIWRESGFHPDKMGTRGERGLMQVGVGPRATGRRRRRSRPSSPPTSSTPRRTARSASGI